MLSNSCLSEKTYVGELSRNIGHLATCALLEEAGLEDKPGLVSPLSKGAHIDMDYALFRKSAFALESYFQECAITGLEACKLDPASLLPILRPIGLEGERQMYLATGGINTHKGALFSLGITASAAGWLAGQHKQGNDTIRSTQCLTLRDVIRRITRGIVKRELIPGQIETAGKRSFQQYGSKGARGQAEDGYSLVFEIMMPSLKKKGHRRDILLNTLLHSIARLDDTCLLSRGGQEGLSRMQRFATSILRAGGVSTFKGKSALLALNRLASNRGLSPGGSADMLALAIFIESLERIFPFCTTFRGELS